MDAFIVFMVRCGGYDRIRRLPVLVGLTGFGLKKIKNDKPLISSIVA